MKGRPWDAGRPVGSNDRRSWIVAFRSAVEMAAREADETLYWLELLAEAEIVKRSLLASLMDECGQLVAILAATSRTAKRNS